ncbi:MULTISPECIES: hypothetical protein [unclassified Mycoplasma]|uniref:hypothetical protein n=1 Tax=unclassified Mycoplasma TaxID=2683645 RepID=UPI0013752697
MDKNNKKRISASVNKEHLEKAYKLMSDKSQTKLRWGEFIDLLVKEFLGKQPT